MNELIQSGQSLTMSSREIAELTEKRHDQVLRDIRNMFFGLGLDLHTSVGVYKDRQGREYPCYNLSKRETLILVSGYNIKMRAAIIDRWQELEAMREKPQQLSRLEILQMALESEKENERLKLEAKENKPKLEYFDRVVERNNLLNATQVGQKVGLSAVALNKHLEQLKVYNRAIKRGRAFQQWFVDKGYGIMRQTDQGYPQAMFTLKGEAWVIENLVSEGIV